MATIQPGGRWMVYVQVSRLSTPGQPATHLKAAPFDAILDKPEPFFLCTLIYYGIDLEISSVVFRGPLINFLREGGTMKPKTKRDTRKDDEANRKFWHAHMNAWQKGGYIRAEYCRPKNQSYHTLG